MCLVFDFISIFYIRNLLQGPRRQITNATSLTPGIITVTRPNIGLKIITAFVLAALSTREPLSAFNFLLHFFA